MYTSCVPEHGFAQNDTSRGNGITESTDAVSIVVSEEIDRMSFSLEGRAIITQY